MLAALLLPSLLAAGADAPADAIALNEPRVQFRTDEASATRAPWIDANGWRMLRDSGRKFVYRVKGEAAALAAAEAFAYGAQAFISADTPGAAAFNRMIEFLKTIPAADLAPVADIGVVDNSELLNLLTRMNLLYRIEKDSDRSSRVNVQEEVRRIRSQIGDENRSLRIYGSEVVIARLLSGPHSARVFLLNYSARPVLGLRVRVRGAYKNGELRAFMVPDVHVTDWTQDGKATEFTIPEFRSFAVIDLSRD